MLFTELPQDVLLAIILALEIEDIIRLRCTSKLLAQLTRTHSLWAEILQAQSQLPHLNNPKQTQEAEAILAKRTELFWNQTRSSSLYELLVPYCACCSEVIEIQVYLEQWLMVSYKNGTVQLWYISAEPSSCHGSGLEPVETYKWTYDAFDYNWPAWQTAKSAVLKDQRLVLVATYNPSDRIGSNLYSFSLPLEDATPPVHRPVTVPFQRSSHHWDELAGDPCEHIWAIDDQHQIIVTSHLTWDEAIQNLTVSAWPRSLSDCEIPKDKIEAPRRRMDIVEPRRIDGERWGRILSVQIVTPYLIILCRNTIVFHPLDPHQSHSSPSTSPEIPSPRRTLEHFLDHGEQFLFGTRPASGDDDRSTEPIHLICFSRNMNSAKLIQYSVRVSFSMKTPGSASATLDIDVTEEYNLKAVLQDFDVDLQPPIPSQDAPIRDVMSIDHFVLGSQEKRGVCIIHRSVGPEAQPERATDSVVAITVQRRKGGPVLAFQEVHRLDLTGRGYLGKVLSLTSRQAWTNMLVKGVDKIISCTLAEATGRIVILDRHNRIFVL